MARSFFGVCTFGREKFVAEIKQIYTPRDLSFSFGKSTEKQGTTGKKPISYITEINLIKISFKIHLSRRLGVDVFAKIEAWKNMAEGKDTHAFTFGGGYITTNRFYVESVSVDVKEINQNGEIITADLSVTIEEYAGWGIAMLNKTESLNDYE
jgi:hypothetical protein